MPRKASKIALSQEEGEKLKRLICRETAQSGEEDSLNKEESLEDKPR